MLYIFHVDTGSMMTFEMNLALESVAHLKEVIERACRIPPEKQVLLVSGGLSLEPTARVCSYSAGTDTNPIFLFSKCSIESVSPPSPSIDYGSDMDLKEQVDASLSMPASYNTVVVRSQLAQQYCELARDQTRICERLVHDQHLQQQGWAAVVANLEDSVSVFRTQGDAFEQSYQQHLESRSQYMQLLENFNEVLNTLSKIPILPGLLATAVESMQAGDSKSKDVDIAEELPQAENISSSMSAAATSDENESMAVSKKSNSSNGEDWQRQREEKAVTLLQWISTKDNQSTLEQMVDQCARGLEQLDERVLDSLRAEVQSALEAATKVDMKEIKGLEERLYGLEQLMFESKRIVQEQSDLAMAFQSNQNRANNLGDASILPDLCASHRRQLHVMSQNHTRLRDIRKRCNRAKEELSVNLYHRLRWIMYVENRMCDVASKLMIYHENLKRLKRHLEVVRQIQMAPEMYVCAVGEVVRRRTFSQAFLAWAGELASQLQAVHSEESSRRRDFQSKFEGHFLNTLFPGMEDCPPPFATQAPTPFDSMLPKLSREDVDKLKIDVPNLAMSLTVPEPSQLANLFLKSVLRTQNSLEKENAAIEKRLVTAVSKANLEDAVSTAQGGIETETSRAPGESPKSLPLKDDRDSETDTEEFEKVGQSPDSERTAGTAATTCEDNLGNAQLQVERAKAQLISVEKVALAATESLRVELGQIKGQVAVERDDFLKLLDTFRVAWEQLLAAGHVAQSAANNLDLKVELERERRALSAKDEIIRTLTQSVEERTATVEQLEASLRQRLKAEEEQRAQAEQLQWFEETKSSVSNPDQQRCAELERRLLELEKDRAHYEDLQTRLDSISKDTVDDLNRALEEQKAALENLHQQRMKQLQDEYDVEKSRALKELSDQLSRDHHSQLEGLRSRFRLMACTSERSTSDSGQEKAEQIVRNTKPEVDLETLVREKEAAIQAAVQETEKRMQSEWESKLQQELRNVRLKMEAEKQVWFNEALRRVSGDRERQLQALWAREATLKEECQKHRETIRRITEDASTSSGNPESNGALWQHQARISQLEAELALARNQISAMGTSVAVVASENVTSRDAATSPEPLSLKKNLTCSANNLLQQGKISILTCVPGDIVLVVWNDTHQNYVILQESSTLFFVNSDSLESLGLSLQAESGKRKPYSTAEVVEKEYCHARKSENRYHVPKGTKFYRVKVRSLHEDSLMMKSSYRPKAQQQLQQHAQPQAEELKKVEISFANESEAVSLPCAASGPLSGSSASSLPEMGVTDASQ
ncbi:RB1-inducible coiled-coil protein 1 isoform X1 [Frankliniella occidentalis]|uniref:RB1-inducible coiled-coil protein 1 n=1 Tax=Frankliniella occidentalis TaxID=133901 RepID=A0A6J1TBL6_FRAOC|nr:RB1-inducible coiled-coil protein 1 isoform X1 [Frankliniella occidentalis]XP_052121175.1 RB1-inducible coiled-coil protein 1 isoform X1 [Frankliniella occidentalis]